MRPKLSIAIIAENEEKLIGDCLKSASFADEIILLDGGSIDKTIKIAQEYKARVIPQTVKEKDWSAWHNQGKKEAQGEWLFYLDADERITPDLEKEIRNIIKEELSEFSAFAVPRLNVLLGKEMFFGGWYPDYQIRLFKKDKLDKWVGRLHERPIFSSKGRSASGGEGQLGYLKQPIKHLTHRDLTSMVEKTNYWSSIEAKLLYEANHPLMAPWRFFRIMGTEFFNRFIKKQAWRDGTVGWIEGLFQVFNKFLIYARLWELQKKKV